jgi:hypothetical protein
VALRLLEKEVLNKEDMVELLDGHSNRVLARFDGRHPPREVLNVTADYVILYFYSDRTNRAQGFALLYQGEPIPRTGTTRALQPPAGRDRTLFLIGWRYTG